MNDTVAGHANLEGLPTTSREQVEATVQRLHDRRDAWVRTSIEQRCDYLSRCIDDLMDVADRWVAEACRRKAIESDSSAAGDEWMSGPAAIARGLRLYRESLSAEGHPPAGEARCHSDGQWVVPVFPQSSLDRLLYFGLEADLWLQPGQDPSQGELYRRKREGELGGGAVAVVLGAGNVASIAPLDVLHKLIVEDEVVALKMNPINDYLGPFIEQAFSSLIDDGFLALVYGGAEQGSWLCHDSRIGSIHLTGSHRTHDAIVWGADPQEQRTRKADNRPLIAARVTSELGCVTPVIVCPGTWSDNELDYQAQHVASMVTNNASFNCNAGKVLVLATGWPQKEAFLDRLRLALKLAAPRLAYYPGARDRYESFLSRYPDAETLGGPGPGVIPWTLISGLTSHSDPFALQQEAFCGVLAQVDLPATGPAEFLDRVVPFANESIWGTLSCSLLIDEATADEHAGRLNTAVAGLRYGGIAINAWAGANFYLGQASWGAYPGHTLRDIQSGIGWVHNTLLFDHPQKTVVRAPFRIWPKPIWFNDHQASASMARSLARFEAWQHRTELLKLAPHALLG